MNTITSRTDIETYVANSHADFCEQNLDGALVAVIQDADHPDYGTDWSEWLDANIAELRADVLAIVDSVTIEEMPDHHRGSHRAAGNWGFYPHNGATRRLVSREEADEIVAADPDNYASIVGE